MAKMQESVAEDFDDSLDDEDLEVTAEEEEGYEDAELSTHQLLPQHYYGTILDIKSDSALSKFRPTQEMVCDQKTEVVHSGFIDLAGQFLCHSSG